MKIRRRVVLHGPSTLTISLPASWVKKFNIKKGDELNLEEFGNELRINSEKELHLEKKRIDIKDFKRLGRNYIISLYTLGYDEISVNYDKSEYIETVRNIISEELIGFEIIKQGTNNCLIKNLTSHNKDEFDNALRRIFLLLLDMSSESLIAIKENNADKLKNVVLMDHNINKFSNYCLRLLVKRGHANFGKTTIYYHLIKSLEEIADRYKDLCDFHLNNKEKVGRDFIIIFGKVNDLLNEFYELFYKYDEEKVEKLFSKIKLTHKKISDSKGRMEVYLSSICKDVRDLLSMLVEIKL